jgi:hypothetical protein
MILDMDLDTDPNTPYNTTYELTGGEEYTQEELYDEIQKYNTDKCDECNDTLWYSDPDGVNSVLNNLITKSGVNYSKVIKTDCESAMHDTLYWISHRKYPGLTTIYEGYHWVTLVGFKADKKPEHLANGIDTVKLETIYYHDPNSALTTYEAIDAETWYKKNDSRYNNYWGKPIDVSCGAHSTEKSKWQGKYLSIIEPPLGTGKAVAKKHIIKAGGAAPTDIKTKARQLIKDLRLYEDLPYKMLKGLYVEKPSVEMIQKPMKVGGDNPYILIPFKKKSEEYYRIGMTLTNDLKFRTLAAYKLPVRYYSQTEAKAKVVEMVTNEIKEDYPLTEKATITITSAKLMPWVENRLGKRGGEYIVSHYLPRWEISYEYEVTTTEKDRYGRPQKIIIKHTGTGTKTIPQDVAPEPCSMLLLGSGLLGLACLGRRKKR